MNYNAEQYYPTYSFKKKNRDVVLLEFEEAQKIANGQTKVYGQVTNILLAVTTVLIPFFFNQEENASKRFGILKEYSIFFSIIIFLFGALILRFFVDLQKQITINARKVVTLRKMLGLDYGRIHLTLPNWRVEGATNPFVIKYFNGWLKFQSMPFWVLTIGVNSIWWIAASEIGVWNYNIFKNTSVTLPWYSGNFFITFTYLYLFRHNLNDTHETTFLNLGRFIVSLYNQLGLSKFKIVDNFEYVIYRAKLDIVEMERLNVDYRNIKQILIEIEDKTFYSNKKGFSFKAIIRALFSQFKAGRTKFGIIRSGGSTITMQLARTLFISTHSHIYKRKIAEIWLAIWLSNKFTKEEILNLYIVSVRYDVGVFGLSKAIKHFFGELKNKTLTREECFVLVERLSNETSTLNPTRIDFLYSKINPGLDKNVIQAIYHKLREEKKVK